MGQTFVRLPDDSANSGKKEDHFATGGTGNLREVVVLGDPSNDDGVSLVVNTAPASDAYGATVRDPATATLALQVFDLDSDTGSSPGVGFAILGPADGGPVILGTTDNPLQVGAASLPLPSGAATAAHQVTEIASLANLDVALSTRTKPADQQHAIIDSSALPSGAATSAAQTTGNNSLASIDGKLPALGQALAAASVPVVLTAAQIITLTPPAAITGFATAAKQPALGTAGSAATDVLSVQGIASMTPLLVTPSSVALPANQSVNVSQINAVTPLMGAGNTGTGSLRVTVASDQVVIPISDNSGSLTVDAPVGTPVFVRLSDGTSAIATLPISVAAGATTIAKAEDAASANADVGVPAMAIQLASPTDLAGTDADYAMLQMAGGRLWVDASGKTLTVASHAVTIASGGVASGALASGALAAGSVVAGAVAAGALSFVKLEDVASADGDAGVPAMAIQKATPADTGGTDGDYTMLQMSAGRLWATANIDKIAGTAADTNSGTKSAGTLRVVLATDQPALTNKLLVTPDSVALPANQSVNVNQLAGTTTDTNSGTKSAGTLRVVLATDQPVLTNKLLVTPDSVALPANQSVNISQVNGVTVLMGAGNTGTGSQRVTIASDQAVIPVSDNSGSLTIDAPVGTPVFVTPTPSTTGGWTPSKKAALSNTNAQVKSGAGNLGGWYIYNPNSSVAYVQIYDTATGSITVGTTAAVLSIGIPATSAANVELTAGINFATAICVAATTAAGNGTAPSTALDCNFWYK